MGSMDMYDSKNKRSVGPDVNQISKAWSKQPENVFENAIANVLPVYGMFVSEPPFQAESQLFMQNASQENITFLDQTRRTVASTGLRSVYKMGEPRFGMLACLLSNRFFIDILRHPQHCVGLSPFGYVYLPSRMAADGWAFQVENDPGVGDWAIRVTSRVAMHAQFPGAEVTPANRHFFYEPPVVPGERTTVPLPTFPVVAPTYDTSPGNFKNVREAELDAKASICVWAINPCPLSDLTDARAATFPPWMIEDLPWTGTGSTSSSAP